jgi:thioredoxin
MITLTDENFEKEIQAAEKPVVVDFMASWCSPCFVLGPILEKLAEEYKDKFILAKVSLEVAPLTAKKFGVDRIPMVVLFNEGKPISGFIGVRPEPIVKELLDKMLKDVNPNMKKVLEKDFKILKTEKLSEEEIREMKKRVETMEENDPFS